MKLQLTGSPTFGLVFESFADAKALENLIEHVFDVNAPRDPPQRVSRLAHVLGAKFEQLGLGTEHGIAKLVAESLREIAIHLDNARLRKRLRHRRLSGHGGFVSQRRSLSRWSAILPPLRVALRNRPDRIWCGS